MGVHLGQEQLGGILADIDHDGTGDIDLLEFIELMVRCGGVQDELELARKAFQQSDTDGSGTIDRDEYIRCIKQLDPSLTTKDIDKMMLLADANNDGVSSSARESLCSCAASCVVLALLGGLLSHQPCLIVSR